MIQRLRDLQPVPGMQGRWGNGFMTALTAFSSSGAALTWGQGPYLSNRILTALKMGGYRNKKSSKVLEASEWNSFLPVCEVVRCRPQVQWQPLTPEWASQNAETQDKRSSTGNSEKHQSTSKGQNEARAQANPLPIRSVKEKRKKRLPVAQPCYGVGPRS